MTWTCHIGAEDFRYRQASSREKYYFTLNQARSEVGHVTRRRVIRAQQCSLRSWRINSRRIRDIEAMPFLSARIALLPQMIASHTSLVGRRDFMKCHRAYVASKPHRHDMLHAACVDEIEISRSRNRA